MVKSLMLSRPMQLVARAGLDGWLVADFRRNNPLFGHLLGLSSGIMTRRAFLWIPADGRGEPLVLASQVDGHTYHALQCAVSLYSGFEDMAEKLRQLLPRGGRVAMEYVQHGKLPTISRVDAGLVEFVRDCGVTVTSSGDLVARLEVWDERQQALHERAARVVDDARRTVLTRCGQTLHRGETLTEGDLGELILAIFAEQGVVTDGGPDVAVGAHAADPHYGVGDGAGAPIPADAVLLIDLWGKIADEEGAPYADSTWMAYTGSSPPDGVVRVFEAVRTARDEAINAIRREAKAGNVVRGRAIDRAARASIERAGLAQYLLHRTGHSLGIDNAHGMGTNLDDIEFPDDRALISGSGVTVEPGLYLPGEFGVRLEVSAILTDDDIRVTTESQKELTVLL